MNHDDYLSQGDPANEPEHECRECGKMTDYQDYCSRQCWLASQM